MQVAFWAAGEGAGRARRTAGDLVADHVGGLGAADVVLLLERPPASVPALVRAADLLVVLLSAVPVGAGGEPRGAEQGGAVRGLRPDLAAAEAVVAEAAAARHVAVVVVAPRSLDELTERWLTRLAAEHAVAREDRVLTVVAAALAERRRCLSNPVTVPGAYDRAHEPREGRTLDEVGIGDPQPRAGPGEQGIGPPAAAGGPGAGSALGADRAGADEQWNEAVQAWRAGLWSAMAEHLRRALARRPLDADAGLWLGRLLAASQSASGRAEAARRITDAARIAEQKGRVHWAAAAWTWVARLERRVDPTAALEAANRAAELVPHRAEPWVERALVHLVWGDRSRASDAALAAYRHHERSLSELLDDTLSPPTPADAAVLVDHVRQVSLDRAVQLLQLATRLGADVGVPGGPAGPDSDVVPRLVGAGQLAAPSPIGAEASDALAAMSLDELAEEGRRLSGAIHAALRWWAADLAEEGRALAAGADPTRWATLGTGVGARAVALGAAGAVGGGVPGSVGVGSEAGPTEPGDPRGGGPPPGGGTIHDRESLAWGLAAAGAVLACGIGLWWVSGSVIWLLLAVVLAGAAVGVTVRAATDPDAAPLDEVEPDPRPPTRPPTPLPPRPPPPLFGGGDQAAPAPGSSSVATGAAGTWPADPGAAMTWPPTGAGPAMAAGSAVGPDDGAAAPLDPVDDWRARLQALGAAIDRAEAITLDWPRLGPAVPTYRARVGDLVALGTAAAFNAGSPGSGPAIARGATGMRPAERSQPGDDDWLPPDLRRLAGPLPVAEPSPPVRLYRLVPAGRGTSDPGASGPAASGPGASGFAVSGEAVGPTGDVPGRPVRWAAYVDASPFADPS